MLTGNIFVRLYRARLALFVRLYTTPDATATVTEKRCHCLERRRRAVSGTGVLAQQYIASRDK